MKRIGALLLTAALLLATGCAYAAIAGQPAFYQLYYREVNLKNAVGEDALRAETVQLDEDPETTQALPEALMQRYLEGPLDESLQSPVPRGTALLSVEVEQGCAAVDLSAPYAMLSGVGLTLADYAITMTLTQLEEISSVRITVQGQELAYREKQVFQDRDVLLAPKEDVVGTVQAGLYFPDEEGVLQREDRLLDLYEGDTQVSAIARALEQGPATKGLLPLFPEGFRIKNLWLEDGRCYANISSALLGTLPGDPEERELVLDGLRRSLCSLETIQEVQFLVDGEFYRPND